MPQTNKEKENTLLLWLLYMYVHTYICMYFSICTTNNQVDLKLLKISSHFFFFFFFFNLKIVFFFFFFFFYDNFVFFFFLFLFLSEPTLTRIDIFFIFR